MKRIENIREACKLSDQAFLFIVKKLKEGLTEKEIAKLIRYFLKEKGADLSFPIIVASGPNAYNIHNKPTDRKIKKGQPIILDFGASVRGLCSDLSRTLFLREIPSFWRNIYKITLLAQEKAYLKAQKERSAQKIDKVARDYIAKKGFGNNFIHTLGHSFGEKPHNGIVVGPKSQDTLKNGDTITIEPGIYIKGRGGVRIEDDYLVRKNKTHPLTKSPKNIKEILIK